MSNLMLMSEFMVEDINFSKTFFSKPISQNISVRLSISIAKKKI